MAQARPASPAAGPVHDLRLPAPPPCASTQSRSPSRVPSPRTPGSQSVSHIASVGTSPVTSVASSQVAAIREGMQRRQRIQMDADQQMCALADKQRHRRPSTASTSDRIRGAELPLSQQSGGHETSCLSRPGIVPSASAPSLLAPGLDPGNANSTCTVPAVAHPISAKRHMAPSWLSPSAPFSPIGHGTSDDGRLSADGPHLSRSTSSATKLSALRTCHRSPSAVSYVLPASADYCRSPDGTERLSAAPSTAQDSAMTEWGQALDPANVKYDAYVAPSLRKKAEQPSMPALRSQLVRLYPQLGTRTMASLDGIKKPVFNAEGQLEDDALPLPLLRSDELGSARGDSVALSFPVDVQGRSPSAAAGLYAAAERTSPNELGRTYLSSWKDVARQAQQYTLTSKQSKKIISQLHRREQDLTLEVVSQQERAEILIVIYTEQREGRWLTREPVHVGPGDQIAHETPQDMDPWSVPVDSSAILARNKLRSNIELSATRMNVSCPQCRKRASGEGDLGPQGSDEEETQPTHEQELGESICSDCGGTRAVEMSFVITVTIRAASFLPLSLPSAHLAGVKNPHLRYGPDGADVGTERESFLRALAVEGAMNAAFRVGRRHHARHEARILSMAASVRRTNSWLVCAKSHKGKCTRIFEFVDPWPTVSSPPGSDPAADSYNLTQHARVEDATRDFMRSQVMAEEGAGLYSAPAASGRIKSGLGVGSGHSFVPGAVSSLGNITTAATATGVSTPDGRSQSPQARSHTPSSGSSFSGRFAPIRGPSLSRTGLWSSRTIDRAFASKPFRKGSSASQASAPVKTDNVVGIDGLGTQRARSGSMPTLQRTASNCGAPRPSLGKDEEVLIHTSNTSLSAAQHTVSPDQPCHLNRRDTRDTSERIGTTLLSPDAVPPVAMTEQKVYPHPSLAQKSITLPKRPALAALPFQNLKQPTPRYKTFRDLLTR